MARKAIKKKKKTSAKKRATKKSSRKKIPRRKVSRKKGSSKLKKKVVRPPRGPKLPAEPAGHVTHYFPKVRAAALMIERDGIRVGDTLYFKGHTTSFKQKVVSMQINHQAVTQASPQDEVGIRVKSRTREHDRVYKL